jgi:hypothetical protein
LRTAIRRAGGQEAGEPMIGTTAPNTNELFTQRSAADAKVGKLKKPMKTQKLR